MEVKIRLAREGRVKKEDRTIEKDKMQRLNKEDKFGLSKRRSEVKTR